MNAFAFYLEDERDLAGLPNWVRKQTRAEARNRGCEGHCFTLKAGLVSAVLECAESQSLRRVIWTAFNSVAAAPPFDNRPVINRILDLRRRRARLLGDVCFSEHVLRDRMIGSPVAVLAFLEALMEKTRPFFDREVAQLRGFAVSTVGKRGEPIAPYDEVYLSEGLRRERYHFDQEELRPYFPLSAVLEGIFEIISRLFGCRVVEKTGEDLWHPDARGFEVIGPDGRLVGRFLGDFYARPGKREGAWVRTLEWKPPSGPQTIALITNFLPPGPDRPCLLAHREVQSLFHEFGHLLHFLLSRASTRALSADEVAWDFVEVPSQLFANWSWEESALRLFARHWQTGAPLPADNIAAVRRSRDFGIARDQMRQIGIAHLDIALHTGWPQLQGGDATAFARDLLQDHVLGDLPEEYALICRFMHAFKDPEGSASGYYGYLWSEVMEADIFSDFQTQGLFNKKLGNKLKTTVLGAGDSRDAQDLFLAFKGRPPDIGALLRRNGMVR
nr:M3 family metallopeptidase [Roseibium album]